MVVGGVSPFGSHIVAQKHLVDGLAGEGGQTRTAGLEPPLTGGLAAIQLIGDLTGGKALRRDRSLTAGDLVAGLGANHTSCVGVAVGNGTGTVRGIDIATGIGNQIAAALIGLDSHILRIAVGDGAAVVTGRDAANDVLTGVDGGIHHIAVGDRTAGEHLTHDAAGTEILGTGGECVAHAGHTQILDGAGDGAKQTIGLLHGGGGGHLQVGDHLAVAVEGAGVTGVGVIIGSGFVVQAGGCNGGPLVAVHVNISGKFAVDIFVAAVYLLHEPDQLGLVGDLVDAAAQGRLIQGPTAGIAEAVAVAIGVILPDGIQGGVSADGNAAARSVRGRSGRTAGCPAQECAFVRMGGYSRGNRKGLCFLAHRRGTCVDVLGHILKVGCTSSSVGIVVQVQHGCIDRTIGLGGIHVSNGGRSGACRCGGIVLSPALERECPSVIGHRGGIGRDLRHIFLVMLHRTRLRGAGTASGSSQIIVGRRNSGRELLIVQVDIIAAGTGVQIHIGGGIAAIAVGSAEGDLRNRGAAGIAGDIDIDIVALCTLIQVNDIIHSGVGLTAAAHQIGRDAVKGGGIRGILSCPDENAGDGLAGIGSGLVSHVDII